MTRRRLLAAAAAGVLALGGGGGGGAPAAAQEAPSAGLAGTPLRMRLEERIISDLSDEEITIQTLYAGSELLVFGTIERGRFLDEERDGPPDLVVQILGPTEPLAVWRKERRYGIWINGERARFPDAPRYYALASTRPLAQMLSASQRLGFELSEVEPVKFVDQRGAPADVRSFQDAVLQARERQGVYRTQGDVRLRGGTLFSARFTLPPNIVSGDYRVNIVLARDGKALQVSRHLVQVKLSGFEQALARAARERPFLYGLGCVGAAILMGWAAAEAFRRLRR